MTPERRAVVLSVADCAYYLVGYTDSPVGQAERIDLVRNDQGRASKFPSVYSVKCWLVNEGAERAWLVMQTPYDEMVGRPEGSSALAEVFLDLIENKDA